MAEIVQPTVFATSSTYLIYTISTYLNLVPTRSADIQFTYYCCILGLISVLVFYARYIINENQHLKLNTVYICILALIIAAYITHWFIPPEISDTSCELDKKKCSRPLHLVLQVAYMICILTSLVTSLI